jgi:phenylalanyl-tRNA synthetase beta chain
MKYSYNWLKELTDTKLTATEIAQLITMHSFEVESVEKIGSSFAGVVVGEILEIAPHPDADKLQLTKVTTGTDEFLDIVCGAKNIAVGDRIPVATVGTILPDGNEIKEASIRGKKSFGMLCALDELGLGSDHSGIFQLDKQIKIGTPFAEVVNNSDEILDIKVLPDRAHDAVSHVAMAREIIALEGGEMDYDYDGLILPKKHTDNLRIEVKNNSLCPRYIGAVLNNVTVGDSPSWMSNRLEACGIKSINNVVDATNYVMLELGQPLHAFDREVIGSEIVVRMGKKDEELTLLDGSVKKLTEDDIIIANKEHALALAGIMGGKESGISEKTTSIIIEAATFKALSIRKTRSRLNIVTDASSRYEKELDPNLAEKAMVRVIEILEHIAGATFEAVVDVYPEPIKPWSIALEIAYIDRLLGVTVPEKTSVKILTSLGIEAKVKNDFIEAKIPTFRLDLKNPEDLIEEIGRLYGYDKVENIAPKVPVTGTMQNENRIFERSLKNILVGHGFDEVYNYSFYAPSDAHLSVGRHLELEMPMNPDQSHLRVSLIPNILKNVRENLKNFSDFSIFEIGKVYFPTGNVLPDEKNMLVGALVAPKKGGKKEKQDLRNTSSFFQAKSVCDNILAQLGITDHYYDDFNVEIHESRKAFWHQTRSAEIKIEGSEKSLGFIGEISPMILERYDIDTRVVMFEFEMKNLLEISRSEREYTPIRKHPIVVRDISLLAGKYVRIDEILQLIQEAGGDIVLDVDLFDAIDFADDTSSFAFHVILGANERTLTGKEIDDTINSLSRALEDKLNVKMRR